MNQWYLLILQTAAVWRITHLLSKEDGPFDLVFKIRKIAGSGFFGNLIDCFYCLSIWIALPFGLITGKGWEEKLLLWFALSGLACLLERITGKDGRNQNETDFFEN